MYSTKLIAKFAPELSGLDCQESVQANCALCKKETISSGYPAKKILGQKFPLWDKIDGNYLCEDCVKVIKWTDLLNRSWLCTSSEFKYLANKQEICDVLFYTDISKPYVLSISSSFMKQKYGSLQYCQYDTNSIGFYYDGASMSISHELHKPIFALAIKLYQNYNQTKKGISIGIYNFKGLSLPQIDEIVNTYDPELEKVRTSNIFAFIVEMLWKEKKNKKGDENDG